MVVDFGSLGGGVRVSCAPGDPASGLSALSAAGYGYSFVPRQPGLVCQINAKPNPCNGAPTNAYWSYWHANRGGSWSYSTSGAGSYNPRAGTVEGWAFGAGARPGGRAAGTGRRAGPTAGPPAAAEAEADPPTGATARLRHPPAPARVGTDRPTGQLGRPGAAARDLPRRPAGRRRTDDAVPDRRPPARRRTRPPARPRRRRPTAAALPPARPPSRSAPPAGSAGRLSAPPWSPRSPSPASWSPAAAGRPAGNASEPPPPARQVA